MKNFFPRFLLVLPVRILDSSLLKTKQNKRVCSLLYLPTFYSHPSQVSIYYYYYYLDGTEKTTQETRPSQM